MLFIFDKLTNPNRKKDTFHTLRRFFIQCSDTYVINYEKIGPVHIFSAMNFCTTHLKKGMLQFYYQHNLLTANISQSGPRSTPENLQTSRH